MSSRFIKSTTVVMMVMITTMKTMIRRTTTMKLEVSELCHFIETWGFLEDINIKDFAHDVTDNEDGDEIYNESH